MCRHACRHVRAGHVRERVHGQEHRHDIDLDLLSLCRGGYIYAISGMFRRICLGHMYVVSLATQTTPTNMLATHMSAYLFHMVYTHVGISMPHGLHTCPHIYVTWPTCMSIFGRRVLGTAGERTALGRLVSAASSNLRSEVMKKVLGW